MSELGARLRAYDQETIRSMQRTVDALESIIKDRDRELEIVTQERDNALLRIEELERTLEDVDPNDRIYRHHNGPESSYRGGVHPNA